MIKIQIILGSTRQEREGEKVAKWVYSRVSQNPDIEVALNDLKDWPLPFFNEPI